MRGNRTESLREKDLPRRGSPKGSPKTSERYTGNEDGVTKGELLEVPVSFRKSSQRKIFLLETLSPVDPHRVAP